MSSAKQAKGVLLKNITREYISPSKTVFRAVDDISLQIEPGEFVTLLGPSGCGKTTTLRMIAGFELPTAGSISIGDEEVNKISADKRDTAMVFQSYALFPHYNVYNNISFGLRLRKLSESEISKRVADIMELVGLSGLEDRFPNQLSGGQQQRVALARALVSEPSVLLFDEPLSNLDAKLRTSMRIEIKKIQRRLGITSIYVTHDQTEAMALSDRIIIMNNGKIEQIGKPDEIYFHPATKFVADFIGRSNFINGTVVQSEKDEKTVRLLSADVPIFDSRDLEPGRPVCCMIRPESLTIDRKGVFRGVVRSSIFMGSMQEYYVEAEGNTLIVEDYDFLLHGAFRENEEVGLSFKPDAWHIVTR